jgi:hypothetical protein
MSFGLCLIVKEKAIVSATNTAMKEALVFVAMPIGNNRNNAAGEQCLLFIFFYFIKPVN